MFSRVLLLWMLFLLASGEELLSQDQYFSSGEFFEEVNDIMRHYVEGESFNYAKLQKDPTKFLNIMAQVDQADTSSLSNETKKAFYLNAYNLTVIKSVLLEYPIGSTNEIPGFFKSTKHIIAGEEMTLDYLENGIIRPQCEDARIHFALNCGAIGCPPIINEAYFPDRLDEQLDRQTMQMIDKKGFIQFDNEKRSLLLNQIFDWYEEDFGNSDREIIDYLNHYRTEKIPNDYKLKYYPYDWTLNEPGKKTAATDLAKNKKSGTTRFLVSSLYDKGEFEINLFNSYFAQQNNLNVDGGELRTNFLSNLAQVLIGITPRINAGFDVQFRSVSGNRPRSEAGYFDALNYSNMDNIAGPNDGSLGYTRTGFSRIGPKVKYLPFKNQSNISIISQSCLKIKQKRAKSKRCK